MTEKGEVKLHVVPLEDKEKVVKLLVPEDANLKQVTNERNCSNRWGTWTLGLISLK